MPWWWPFSSSPEIRKVAPPEIRRGAHIRLAAQYFWMQKPQQLKVLYYLEIPFEQQSIVYSRIQPFSDVEMEMVTQGEPEKPLTAELFMDKLKALELVGKEIEVVGVLQNFFDSIAQARSYLPAVAKWPAVLKEDDRRPAKRRQ